MTKAKKVTSKKIKQPGPSIFPARPLRPVIGISPLTAKVEALLAEFYSRRIAALDTIDLEKTLRRKNPYLYKATGKNNAADIVNELLVAHTSSSDETLFGNIFFEPLALWVAQESFRNNPDYAVTISHGEGIDMSIEHYHERVSPIAVKSGPNVFNAASKKKQAQNFVSLRARLSKAGTLYDPIIGYCYGKKKQRIGGAGAGQYRELAGQMFWFELTGEPDFYLRIIDLMGVLPVAHAPLFEAAFDRASNRLATAFLNGFQLESGAINWEKFAMFNSAAEVKIKLD
ncbi:PmeII family type II restriction endonuclease [Lysobacter sp. A289]